MKNLLTTLHRWLGIPIGLLFLLAFGTGFLTSIDELVKRAKSPSTPDWHYQHQSPREQAHAITYLLEHNAATGYIQMPRANAPFYRLISREGQSIHASDNLDAGIAVPRYSNGFFDTALQLHRNLLLGRENVTGINGAEIMAWAALISLFLSLLGLYLWWPLRRKFRLRDAVPKSLKRKNLYMSHMTAGVITLIPVIMLALTGAAITYRDVAKDLLGVTEAAAPAPVQLDATWQAWLEAGYTAIPNGQLKAVQMPRQPRPEGEAKSRGTKMGAAKNETAAASNDKSSRAKRPASEANKRQNQPSKQQEQPNTTATLVFESPNDWWGLANSKVIIDIKSAQLLQVNDFGSLSFGAKLLSIVKPLHTGRELPVVYVLVLFLFSALGTVMVFSGIYSFIKKKRPWLAAKFKSHRLVLKP